MQHQHPVLARLLSSNSQWADAVDAAEPGFFTTLAEGQSPKVLWIGCADSRVPESVVTASRPGDIFVHRNIANQFHPEDTSALAVLQYAVQRLEVEHVIIVGHTQCGGATACFAASCRTATDSAELTAAPAHPPTDPINIWLKPLVDLAVSLRHPDTPQAEGLSNLVNENVKAQVANVAGTEIIKKAWAEKKGPWVHGWVFEIETGKLRDLGVSKGPDRL